MSSVSSFIYVGLNQEMIDALGLPLKIATIIPGCIFSILFSEFRTRLLISIPTHRIVALTEVFHADTVASSHPLPASRYLISSLCVYQWSWMHVMSILWSIADTVSSCSCPILFKVLMLNVAICTVCLQCVCVCVRVCGDMHYVIFLPGPWI